MLKRKIGDKGIPGMQGDKGIAGIQGDKGIVGIQGEKGVCGDHEKGQKGEPGQDGSGGPFDQVEVVQALPASAVEGKVVLCDTLEPDGNLDPTYWAGKAQLAIYIKGKWWRIDLQAEEGDTDAGF